MFACGSEFGAVIDVRVNRRGPSRDLPVVFYFLRLTVVRILCCSWTCFDCRNSYEHV